MFESQVVGWIVYCCINYGLLPILGLYGLIRLSLFVYKWATNSGKSYLYLPLVSSIYIYLVFNILSFLGYFSMKIVTGEKCAGDCGLIIVVYGAIFLGVLVLNLLTQFIIAIMVDKKRTKNKIIK